MKWCNIIELSLLTSQANKMNKLLEILVSSWLSFPTAAWKREQAKPNCLINTVMQTFQVGILDYGFGF